MKIDWCELITIICITLVICVWSISITEIIVTSIKYDHAIEAE